jgi:hypothetical protein
MPSRLTLAAVLLCALALAAAAKPVTVGKVEMNLLPPQGFCEMEAEQPSDARMLKMLDDMLSPSGNRLLGMSADCTQLTDWRTLKKPLLDDMAQFQIASRLENVEEPAPQEAVLQACDEMRTQGERMVTDMVPDLKLRTEQVMKKVQVNDMQFMGVVGQDALACYAAVLQKFKTETGGEKTQVNLFATTIIKGKLIYYYLMTPYVSSSTVTELLDRHKVNVEKLHEANR